MLTLSEGKSTFVSKKVGKKIPAKIALLPFFMIVHPPSLYKEILECYDYETRNPTIYGNVIRGEMEFTQGSKQLQLDIEGNENNLQ